MPIFSASHLTIAATRLFSALGTPEDLADMVAHSLVGSNLAGHDSHGISMLPIYAGRVRSGEIQPTARPHLAVSAKPRLAALTVDAAFGWGPPAGFLATDRVIERAQHYGIAVGVIHNCSHIGRMGQYIERIAEHGLIGIGMCNAGPSVAPFGGLKPMLGTNPITIGAPRAAQGGTALPPLMVDGSTSMAAGNKVRIYLDKGLSIPSGWIIDRDGNDSIQPIDLMEGGALLPLGASSGHKGYGLAVMVEALAGLLTGSSTRYLAENRRGGNGVLFIAIDPAAFIDFDEYQAQIETLCASLKTTPPRLAGGEVLLPGEPEARARADRLTHGVELTDSTWQALTTLAGDLGVSLDESTG